MQISPSQGKGWNCRKGAAKHIRISTPPGSLFSGGQLYILLFLCLFVCCTEKKSVLLLQNEKECAYYLKTGQCKYANTCKFHHPELFNVVPSSRGSPIYPSVHSSASTGPQSYTGTMAS
jgi:hypothetical protein